MRIRSKQIEIMHNISFNGFVPTNTGTPVNDTDVTNKHYVDTRVVIAGSGALWGGLTGDINEQTDLMNVLNNKKDSFYENTAFNKNFGTTIGTVSEGNHKHDTIVNGTTTVQCLSDNISVNKKININSNKIINLGDPVDAHDAANKKYIDDKLALVDLDGIQWGEITGTLTNQIDLQTVLNTKANTTHTHTLDLIVYRYYFSDTEMNTSTLDILADRGSWLIHDFLGKITKVKVYTNSIGTGTTAKLQLINDSSNYIFATDLSLATANSVMEFTNVNTSNNSVSINSRTRLKITPCTGLNFGKALIEIIIDRN